MRTTATREDLDDVILDAADRLLARYGYRKMTMEDLAHEVGIGKGTIYLHFRSKEDLVLSHIDRLISRLGEQLTQIARGQGPPAERLKQMLVTRVLFRFDGVQHYTESLSDLLAAIRPALLVRRERHFEAEAQIFAEVLREGQREGAFAASSNAPAAARTLLLATNALLPYSLSPVELGHRRDVERAVTQIADLMLDGLLRR
ncbi:MAG TPA: helix-turn-helix domain-containing protein [Pyrinomonadaceae bacterium]|nr:helix-turn-helix domain-containing protein [Pyrinomonadaceae bacterium]